MADASNTTRLFGEADDAVKPACEVHGGDLFVKLHFKALSRTPGVNIVNTVVTSTDESAAKFSGCGKHVVALTTGGEDDETPLPPKAAEAAVRKYCSVMFGEDVGKAVKAENIQVVDTEGAVMARDMLKKWEDQQKNGENAEGEEPDTVSETVPRFGRFVGSVISEAEDGDTTGEESEGDTTGEQVGFDTTGEKELGDTTGEESEGDTTGEKVFPPATYIFWYNIVAEGQPEKDHTPELEQLAKGVKGKLMLPGGSEWGIKFRGMGGSWDDGISFKKLGKELKGEIDGEQLNREITRIFSKNFPMIEKPEQGLRDARTVLDGMAGMKFKEGEFTAEVQKRIRDSAYSYYIQFKDNPAKPYMQKSDVVDMVNAALKQMGGRWLKFKSGISEKNVIELHATTGIGADTKASRDAVFRAVLSPIEIRNKIDGKNGVWFNKDNGLFDPAKALDDLQKKFNALRKENSKFDDPSVKELLSVWYAFFKKYETRPDSLTVDEIKKFHEEYSKKYKELRIGDRLDESTESERGLMEDLFGELYEEESDNEEGDDVGLDAGNKDNGGSGGSGESTEIVYGWTIFVLPLPQLNKAFSDSNYY